MIASWSLFARLKFPLCSIPMAKSMMHRDAPEMGVEGITPMDPSGIDYRDYKRRFGSRLTLFGILTLLGP